MSRHLRPFLAGAAFLALAAPYAARAQTSSAPAGAGQTPEGPAASPAAAAPGETPAICTDRPTKVFATCTVDPGHLQVESDLFNGSFLRLGGVTTDTYLVTNPTLKYGVTKSLDVEVNIAPYEVVRTHDKFGGGDTLGGVGDLYLRAKYAAFASADGKFAVSLVPYVKAPVARSGIGNGGWEGGSAVAVSYKLSDVWTLALSPELDAYQDGDGSGRHLNHIEVVNLARSLPHNVTVYGELWGDWNYDPSGTIRQYTADVAVAWGLSKYLQLDAGLNFGLNRYAPGVQAYAGVSQKF